MEEPRREREMTDEQVRRAIRDLAARIGVMTDRDAHNALCEIWWAQPRHKRDQIKELAARLDDLTDTQLPQAISAVIHS